MLNHFFNVNDKVEGTEFYINRSMIVATLVISAMQKLDKELTGTNILEVFKREELIREIQDEIINKFPESEETRLFNEFENKEFGSDFKSCFETIKPLISRLELRNNV